jgi:taurine--2-oxoglutarate transaminase
MTLAKGMTSGYLPLGATVVRKHIGDHFKQQFFSHGATYAGHALGCATAMALIQRYQEDNLIENSAVLGAYMLDRAQELKEKHPCVGDVRGLGLFVGLELVKNKKSKEPFTEIDAKIRPGMNPKLEIAKKLDELGIMAMAANPGNVIALAPPLIITRAEIDVGLEMIDKALYVGDQYAE